VIQDVLDYLRIDDLIQVSLAILISGEVQEQMEDVLKHGGIKMYDITNLIKLDQEMKKMTTNKK